MKKRLLACMMTATMVLSACGQGTDGRTEVSDSKAVEITQEEKKEESGGTEEAGTTFGIEPMEKRTDLRVGFFVGV